MIIVERALAGYDFCISKFSYRCEYNFAGITQESSSKFKKKVKVKQKVDDTGEKCYWRRHKNKKLVSSFLHQQAPFECFKGSETAQELCHKQYHNSIYVSSHLINF